MSTSLPKELDRATLPNPVLLVHGEREHAIELSKRILESKHAAKIDSGNHPDVHFFQPEGKSLLHPVATIEKIIKEMALPPFEATSKIFIILASEKMLPASSNRLLKTLEEPNPDTFFILLSDHPNKLLPTIQSRLNPIQFTKKKLDPIDITSFIELAERGEWDLLLDRLESLEGENPDRLFEALLNHSAEKGDHKHFFDFSVQVSEARQALDHHVKLKTILLHLFACQ